jgi:hypothetical protein
MSLEQALQDNTAALKAFTAAFGSGNALTAAPKALEEKIAKAEKTVAAPAKAATKKEEPASDIPDYEKVVKPAVIAYVKANTREAMDQILLDNFEVKSAKDLKPNQYQALLGKLNEAADDVA